MTKIQLLLLLCAVWTAEVNPQNDHEYNGEHLYDYIGSQYVERKLTLKSSRDFLSSSEQSVIMDTATALTRKIVNNFFRKIKTPLIAIAGEMGMGKSAIMAKMQFEMCQSIPKDQVVRIELESPEALEKLTSKPLKRNHKQLIILFDGIDHCYRKNLRTLLSIISKLFREGAIVVVSGRMQSLLRLASLQPIVYEIPEMNISEIEDFLKNYWTITLKEFDAQRELTYSTKQRLDDYVTAFAQTFIDTPLPRTPQILSKFAYFFAKLENSPPMAHRQYSPADCVNYVLGKTIVPSKLLAVLHHTPLHKMILFDHLLDNTIDFQSHVPPAVAIDFYGPLALKQILNGYPNERDERLEYDLEYTKSLLERDGKEKFRFVKIYGDTVEFIHSEYQHYFAAKYILIKMCDLLFPEQSFKTVLQNSKYKRLTEFVYSGMDGDLMYGSMPYHGNLLNIIENNGKIDFELVDNLLKHGFDKLTHMIFKVLLKNHFSDIKKYLLQENIHELVKERRFGMEVFSVKVPSSVRLLNTASIFYNEMVECLNLFKRQSPPVAHLDKTTSLELLRKAVTRPLPNLQIINSLVTLLKRDLSQRTWNDLLYETISNVGVGCDEIAKLLIANGAKPRNINVNGRTLLHAAVEWRNRAFLKYVIEDLEVPAVNRVDNNGRTVFDTALDANPFPANTPSQWWDMMDYLMTMVPVQSSSIKTPKNMKQYMITQSDIDSPWFGALLLLNTNDIRMVNLHTEVPVNDPIISFNYERNAALCRIVRPINSGLSFGALAARRKLLIEELYAPLNTPIFSRLMNSVNNNKKVSITELLVHYRGVDELTAVQHEQYRQTIQRVLAIEMGSMMEETKLRMMIRLVDNIVDDADIEDFESVWDKFTKVDRDNMRYKLHSMLEERAKVPLTNNKYLENPKRMTLKNRLLQSRADFHLTSLRPQMIEQINEKLIKIIINAPSDLVTSKNNDVENFGNLRKCMNDISNRFARSTISSTCYINWNVVDQFNDVHNDRSINNILINSDKYLNNLVIAEYSNNIQARQLIQLGHYLENFATNTKFITGNSKMLTRDVLRHGGWINYHQSQRLDCIIHHLYYSSSSIKSSESFKLPSRKIVLWGAASLPMIRGLHSTIVTCLHQHNDTDNNCLYASSVLAVSAVMAPISFAAIKFTPWIINEFSQTALDILPKAFKPKLLLNNIADFRYYGMKYGGKFVNAGLGLIGVAFDLYNIIEMSRLISVCSELGSNCVNKDQIDFIISLSFSCASIVAEAGILIHGVLMASTIAFAPGVIIGLALMVLQALAMGINEVIYYDTVYHTTFGENFRIFLHKIAFLQPPADVQALKQRTDWINYLQDRAFSFMLNGNENIVAYAMGIGTLHQNGQQVLPSTGFIDLQNKNAKNGENLSRIQMKTIENTTVLCYPQRNLNAVYDYLTNPIRNDVNYKCKNTFVLVHEERWRKKNQNNSYIIYDLELIDSGTIIGSNEMNNLFIIYNGSTQHNIIGGMGFIVNTLIIRTDTFRGNIVLRESRKNNLDLSLLNSSISFTWHIQFRMGRVQFGENIDDTFYISTHDRSLNLHVTGRTRQADSFYCNYKNYNGLNREYPIIIDGRGGESSISMDNITNCRMSVLYPFTSIEGSSVHANMTFITYVSLGGAIMNTGQSGLATIRPRVSQFLVIFINRPLFSSTQSVEYSAIDKSLRWKFHFIDESLLNLKIEPYISSSANTTLSSDNSMKISAITTVLKDNYFNTTIFPVIDVLNGTGTVTVRQFNIFGVLNTSEIQDVYSNYHDMNVFIVDDDFRIVTKLTNWITNVTFLFGSIADDRFLIDASTMLLFGGDGCDVYVLNKNAPYYFWIDNQANDDALDTLLITDTTCVSLQVVPGAFNVSDGSGTSSWDVKLICSVDSSTSATLNTINILLRNYLFETSNQHLQIYWHNATYVLVPQYWTTDNGTIKHTSELGLFFSLDKQPNAALILTSRDNCILINGTDLTNPLVAYRSQVNDIVLTQQYLQQDSSSFVVMKDFFFNGTAAVNPKWSGLKIFTVQNFNSHDYPMSTLDIVDIQNMLAIATADDGEGADFIQEYRVNITSESKHEVIIDHNSHDDVIHGDRIGVLAVFGAEPGDFHANLDTNGSSLLLCAHEFCINVRNWCHSNRRRLHRMEFFNSLQRHQPIVIENFNQFECQQIDVNNSANELSIRELNETFMYAQKQLQLIDNNDDDDMSRLLRCIGSIFADNIARKYMFKVFGFITIIEQMRFMTDNCNELFAVINIERLKLEIVKNQWIRVIKKFKNNVTTQQNDESVELVSKYIRQLDSTCWNNFITYCTTELQSNGITLVILHDGVKLLLKCVKS